MKNLKLKEYPLDLGSNTQLCNEGESGWGLEGGGRAAGGVMGAVF